MIQLTNQIGQIEANQLKIWLLERCHDVTGLDYSEVSVEPWKDGGERNGKD